MRTKTAKPIDVEGLAGDLDPARHCSWTRGQLRAVLLHYGATFLYMRRGHGYRIRSKHVGVGIYDVWLEEAA